MSRSVKAELETWAAALKAYDAEDFEKALDLFTSISDSSKILTNMSIIHATLGRHEAAVERYIEAIELDSYLAVACAGSKLSNFLLGRYEPAHKNFEDALFYLRGTAYLNYEQLGLNFTLFLAEVLFNQGLSLICLGRMEEGLADMEAAKHAKVIDEHNIIDDRSSTTTAGNSRTLLGEKVKNTSPRKIKQGMSAAPLLRLTYVFAIARSRSAPALPWAALSVLLYPLATYPRIRTPAFNLALK
ncbi:hypothetical protein DFH09DRAFT_1032731 [Mycena vulgaris]|nr:hypothetical protein DFH09DRAFT_1032731 [Mycena vulgaris]